MPSPKSIYLAGPITGLSYGEARHGWRQVFSDRLKELAPHIECFSPMRAKEFLDGQQALECAGTDLDKINNALCRPLGILARDSNDVAERDLIVANFLGAKIVSIGTVWELGHAAAFRKKVVVIIENPKVEVVDTKLVRETVSDRAFHEGNEAVLAELHKRGHKEFSVKGHFSNAGDGTHTVEIEVPGTTRTIQNIHEHIFVTHNYGWRVDNLEEAALISASVLTPGI